MKKLFIDNSDYRIELKETIIIGELRKEFIDLNCAKKLVQDRLQISDGKTYHVLIKIKSLKNITKEARDYLASEKGCEGLLSGAICVNTLLENTIANLFLYLNNPIVPTKIFNNEVKAKEWLMQWVMQQ